MLPPTTPHNPRYVLYAKAHGKSPEDMLKHDKEVWPGGCMCGFIIWIGKQERAFFKAHPECFFDRYLICDQNAWTKWLEDHSHFA
jgi:hypothetical protein